MNKITKTTRLLAAVARKLVTKPGEAWLLLRMGWWVVVVSVTARCYSLPRALAIVAGDENSRHPSPTTQGELARMLVLHLSGDVFLFKLICWKRAAVLHRYLLRNGTQTRIIFGVRNEAGGKVAGHAWLEANGQPILESTPPEYVVTYSFPSNDHFDPRLATITARKI